jgi:hypothetical protein
MARVIDANKVEWDSVSSRARFPWAEWTDGKAREVVYGVDFNSPPSVFTAQLRKRATDNNLKVKYAVTKETEDSPAKVVFQFEK